MNAPTRRSFVKAMAASGALAGAAALGLDAWQPLTALAQDDEKAAENDAVTTIRSACRNCYGRCTINGIVKNNRLIRVEGRPGTYSEGTVCSRAFAIPQLVNSPLRIRYPMKRAGERGEGKWERITWDEAWEIIVPKFKEVIEQYGGHTILANNGTGRDQLNISVLQKCFYEMGSVGGFGVGSICKIAGDFVQRTTIGNPCQFTGWNPEETNLIVMWARGMFSWGYYDWIYIKKALDRGAKLMVVDPRHTAAAAKADLWVPIRPTSDMALILAIINEMLVSERYDKAFAAQWTNASFLVNDATGLLLRESDLAEGGSENKLAYWDETADSLQFWDAKELAWSIEDPHPALLGSHEANGTAYQTSLQKLADTVAEWTVEKTAETTWLSVEQVKEAIELFIESSPGACFTRGQKTDFSDNSSGVSHAFTIMMALAGNYEIPGGNSVKPGTRIKGSAVFDAMPPKGDVRQQVEANLKDYSMCPDVGKIYGIRDGVYSAATHALTTGKPFKPRIYWGMNSDPIVSCADSKEVAEGLKNIDFSVCVSLLMSPTTELADIVLPAAHQNEIDRIEYPQSGHCWPANHTATIRQPFTEPQGESRDEVDILFELAQRIGVDMTWKDKYDWFNFALKATGMTFEEFREQGEVVDEIVYGQHEKGLLRKDKKPGFETKTGKVNIFSEELQVNGWSGIPGYREQPQSPVSEPDLAADYPYVMLTGGRNHQYFHSEYRESAYMRSIRPFPLVEINPNTARENGIEDGDWVCIESSMGSIKQVAHLTAGIDPRVVHCDHDWWFPEKSAQAGLHGAFDCNPNAIVDNDKVSDPATGTDNFSTLCRIYKAPDGPPEGVYTAPDELNAFIGDGKEA
ncbi:molybdopterin-containing oxidoreductase family protein [Raoultibacter phocaeensis]|uniref:molybdopterin-containing oxidoreductase family protein n=1 Tax=Raoultibacter phocaeensis TaxID=2479841 RepID=UPI0015D649E8|nr:molybdopterin-dependent oxidoreductase [Raoultibacter phocaeensis]